MTDMTTETLNLTETLTQWVNEFAMLVNGWIRTGHYDEQMYAQIMKAGDSGDVPACSYGSEWHKCETLCGDEYKMHGIEAAVKFDDIYLCFNMVLRDVKMFGRKAEIDENSIKVVDCDDNEIDSLTYEVASGFMNRLQFFA